MLITENIKLNNHLTRHYKLYLKTNHCKTNIIYAAMNYLKQSLFTFSNLNIILTLYFLPTDVPFLNLSLFIRFLLF